MRATRFALGYSVFFAAMLVVLFSRQAHALLLEVQVATSFGEQPGHVVTGANDGFTAGTVGRALTDSFEGATATGSATSAWVSLGGLSRPTLNVFATGTKFDDGMKLVGADATVLASATDRIGFGNELLIDPSRLTPLGDLLKALNPILWFPFHISGSISNRQGAAASAFVLPVHNPTHLTVDSVPLDGPTSIDTTLLLHLPLFDLEPFLVAGKFDPEPAELRLSISATGGTDLENNDGTTDFSHTMELLPLFITDPNGNPIPGSENANIVGEADNVYAMRAAAPTAVTVSEPAMPGLIAIAGLALLLIRRRVGASASSLDMLA
jgi:hypothetical protein